MIFLKKSKIYLQLFKLYCLINFSIFDLRSFVKINLQSSNLIIFSTYLRSGSTIPQCTDQINMLLINLRI